ncbi:MAG: CDGSH iron-sulfur domain-containing protein [Alphaproteobacteria bacterium]|nr:CDGSH iron-sulfur domain-containing protein [Alphaproteobacteria bacterium]
MATPNIAQKSPYGTKVEAGKSYWWCACGLSKTQPLCDGSHKPTEFEPFEYKATESTTVWFCGCKRTVKVPMCDGSHTKI